MKKSLLAVGTAAGFLLGYAFPVSLFADEISPILSPVSSSADFSVTGADFTADNNLVDEYQLQIEPNEAEPEVSGSETDFAHLYEEGRPLLDNKKWQDAKIFYEKALKKYPERDEFHQAYLFSRAHYEVENRYRDGSYCRFLADTDKEEIMALCDDILKNIQTWYVDAPDWNHLFSYGMNSLKIALTEDTFLRQNRVPKEYDARLPQYGEDLVRYAAQWNIQSREELREKILRVAESVQRNTNISGISVIMEILCGMVNSLDSYSAYLTSGQISDVYSMIDGHFVGLGVYIESKWDGDALLISKVIPGSPAASAGLVSGDRILKIDGHPVTDEKSPEAAGELLQGEEGSRVELIVLSADQNPRKLIVLRKSFDIPSVEDAKYLSAAGHQHILFFRINAFQKGTVDEVKAELARFEKTGIDSLIIDLRNNPGGLLDKAVELSDLFLESGTIVRTKGRASDNTAVADSDILCKAPIVLLMDENSASAAEIFAGAIQENHRGTVVGTRSFGKGTVQVIIQLGSVHTNNLIAGLRLTTEKFYSPLGRSYSGIGVIPDVDVSNLYAAARPESVKAVSLDSLAAMESQKSDSDTASDICLAKALEETESILAKRNCDVTESW